MRSNAWRSPADLLGGAGHYATVGDLIHTGANCHPKYQVIAVAGDRAWIRDIQHGADHVVPVQQCRKLEAGGA